MMKFKGGYVSLSLKHLQGKIQKAENFLEEKSNDCSNGLIKNVRGNINIVKRAIRKQTKGIDAPIMSGCKILIQKVHFDSINIS